MCAACPSALRCAQDAIAAKRFVQAPSTEEHVRGRNLRDALHIAAGVADAIASLHGMDIIHGRLTPNVNPKTPENPIYRSGVPAQHGHHPRPAHAQCVWLTASSVIGGPHGCGAACIHVVPCHLRSKAFRHVRFCGSVCTSFVMPVPHKRQFSNGVAAVPPPSYSASARVQAMSCWPRTTACPAAAAPC